MSDLLLLKKFPSGEQGPQGKGLWNSEKVLLPAPVVTTYGKRMRVSGQNDTLGGMSEFLWKHSREAERPIFLRAHRLSHPSELPLGDRPSTYKCQGLRRGQGERQERGPPAPAPMGPEDMVQIR